MTQQQRPENNVPTPKPPMMPGMPPGTPTKPPALPPFVPTDQEVAATFALRTAKPKRILPDYDFKPVGELTRAAVAAAATVLFQALQQLDIQMFLNPKAWSLGLAVAMLQAFGSAALGYQTKKAAAQSRRNLEERIRQANARAEARTRTVRPPQPPQ